MFDSTAAWLRDTIPSPATLSPGELIDAMADLARVESAVAERKLAVVAALADDRLGEQCDAEQIGRWDADGLEIAESEVSAALTVARHHAGRLISLGLSLRDRLPQVRAALAAGQLDVYRATVIDTATRNVTDELIAEVEHRILEKALAPAIVGGTGLTGRRLTNVCARIIGAVDPAGVRERRRQTHHDRHIGMSPAEDAMITLFGSLPAEDGRKLDTRLRELANSACPRDPRTFDQRKADALGALVDGLTHLPCTCGREDCAQQPGDGAGWVARKPLVHVIVLSSTLSGADEEPGYLDGYGLIDAEHARDLATNGNRQPVRVPDTATDATGPAEEVPLPSSAYIYRPSAILDTWIRILGGMCQWLHCDAPVWNTDLDHDTPFNHGDPTAGGRTTAAGMKPYCRHHHRLKHCGAWAERHNTDRSIDLLAPTGHHYRTSTSGYLDLLDINPSRVIDPDDTVTQRRRTRAENKAASIRAERRQRQAEIDLAKVRPRRPREHGRQPPPEDDCPF